MISELNKALNQRINELVKENKRLLGEKIKAGNEIYELCKNNHELKVQIDSMSEIILDLEASNDANIKR